MASQVNSLQVYKELANWYERRGQAPERDRFLVLAADAASAAGQKDEAERLRQHLLDQNPHHLLKTYASFAEALKAPDVQAYIQGFRRRYPPAAAQELLQSLQERPEEGPRPTSRPVPPTATDIQVDEEDATLPLADNQDLTRTAAPRKPEVPPGSRATPPPPTVRPPATRPAQPPAARKEGPARPAPTVNMPRPLAPPTRTQSPAPRTQAPAVRPPAPATHSTPLAPAGPTYAPPPAETTEPRVHGGAWLGMTLFVLTLSAGLALLVCTLGRPYLPIF